LFLTIVRYFFAFILKAFLEFCEFFGKKRVEASFGLYTQLLINIKNLQLWLDERELLEINDPNKGNIYTLIYESRTQKKVCSAFKKPSDEQLEGIKNLASQLKKTINESKYNVYPKVSEKERWYNSQILLLEFCEFLEDENKRENTNIAKISGENSEYKHIVMCRNLVNAMNYIKESIKKDKNI